MTERLERTYHGCKVVSTTCAPVFRDKQQVDDGWSHEVFSESGQSLGKFETLAEAISVARCSHEPAGKDPEKAQVKPKETAGKK